jgi:hypothetical protein
MGRGLSKLQQLILDEAKKGDVVLFEKVCAMLCPNPQQAACEAILAADCPDHGDLLETFLSLAGQRDSRPDIWNSARETTQDMPGISAGFKAYEGAERKRPIVEASVSRAFTRLERRGLVERVDLRTWKENDQGKHMNETRRRGIRLTVKSGKPVST